MQVTELEYVALTMMATRSNVLQSRFGPGWVELLDTPENQWAFDALRGMRAEQSTPHGCGHMQGRGAA